MHTHMHIHVYIYIYIYIHICRPRDAGHEGLPAGAPPHEV